MASDQKEQDKRAKDLTGHAELLSSGWWYREGRFIDPDTEDVPWYDKRIELAQMAFIAGYKAGKHDA